MLGSLITAIVVLAVIVGCAALYALPLLIGWARRVPHLGSVAAVNLLLGWTLAGWAVALAMALRSAQPAAPFVQVVQNPPPLGPPPGHWPPPSPRPAAPAWPPSTPAPGRPWTAPPRPPGAPPPLGLPSRIGGPPPRSTGRPDHPGLAETDHTDQLDHTDQPDHHEDRSGGPGDG
jgi:T4 superinfection immunity protein